jgi:DNA-binding transcriptional LysR family regulator
MYVLGSRRPMHKDALAMCNDAHVDWDDLRFVLALSRAASLGGAGDALGVTHTTVGRRLKRLEADLGVRLFDRRPDGFFPTPAGIDLTEVATEVETRLLEAEGRVKGLDSALEGTLHVSTLDWLFEEYVEVFASFCERYPAVELTVGCTPTNVSLFRRETDVALRLTNSPPETLVGRRLSDVQFAVYGHRRFAGQDWACVPWLHWEEGTEMARWLDGWLAEQAPGAQTALRLGQDTLVRRSALKRGMGVHPLPCFEGDREPDLVQIGPVLTSFTRGLWVLTLPALSRTRRVRAFVEHLTAHARRAAGRA